MNGLCSMHETGRSWFDGLTTNGFCFRNEPACVGRTARPGLRGPVDVRENAMNFQNS